MVIIAGLRKAQANFRTEAAKASKYLRHVSQAASGIKLHPVARKSTEDKRESLNKQMGNLKRRGRELEFRLSHGVKIVMNGGGDLWVDRLAREAEKAKGKGCDDLLMESASRARRHPSYHPVHAPDLLPDSVHWREIEERVCLPIYLLVHPDASREEEQAYQQTRSGGGRPAKRKRITKPEAVSLKSKAVELRRMGFSLGSISKRLGCSKASVQFWVKFVRNKQVKYCYIRY